MKSRKNWEKCENTVKKRCFRILNIRTFETCRFKHRLKGWKSTKALLSDDMYHKHDIRPIANVILEKYVYAACQNIVKCMSLDLLNPAQPKTAKIRLQTSAGRDIDNYQLAALSQMDIKEFAKYEQYDGVKFKGQPTAIYNCHGLTFASRRTSIDSTAELKKILIDDKYIQVREKDVMEGDVILYKERGTGEFTHTGMVIYILNEGLRSIWVLSKWGKYKEAIHEAHNCVYAFTADIEYYRNNHGYIKET